MRRLSRLIAAITLLGCGHEGSPIVPERGPLNRFTGTFTLVTVNGGALPAIISPAGAPIEITRSTITLRADQTFLLVDVIRNAAGGDLASEESAGTYEFNETDVSLRFTNKVYTGGLDGDNLTLHRGSPTFLYRR